MTDCDRGRLADGLVARRAEKFGHALATRIANFAADSFDNNQLIDRFVCNYHILLSSFRLMDGFHSIDFLDPR